MSETAEYAPGRLVDSYGQPSSTTVLIWHGRGPNERGVLETLATAVAALGVRVLVPDWDSSAEDGGRADLLRSARFAREADPTARLVVVGWSLGGTAAASLALNARRLGLGSVPVVCLAGAFHTTDPLSGQPFETITVSSRQTGSIRLVHGTVDDITPIEVTRDFVDTLIEAGWDSSLTELATDHAGIVGTEFTDDRERCIPSNSPRVLDALHAVTVVIGNLAANVAQT